MLELENMTLLELRNFAKEQNIKNISKLKKEELVMLLKQVAETSKPQEKVYEPEIKYDRNDEEQFEQVGESVIDYKVTNEDDEIVEITLTDDKLTYQLNWVVLPEDAANKGVTFTLSRDIAIVSGTGVITFFDEGSVTIIMSTNDGRRITDSLMIVATFDD